MRTNKFYGRDWISPELNYSKEEWESLIRLAEELKTRFALNEDTSNILDGQTLYAMFFNSSLRTRSTFATGIQQLGGNYIELEPGKTYTPARKGYEIPYKTERVSDVARVLSRTGDAIAIRMYGKASHWIYGFAHETLKEFAHWSDIPIINMEDDVFHPCQALADMLTIKEKFHDLKKKKFVISWAYSGSVEKPYAVPQSAALAPSLLGMDVVLARPKGFELDPMVTQKCKEYAQQNNSSFEETDDMEAAFENAHVVYPKSWGARNYFAQYDKNGNKTKEADLEGMKALFEKNKDWICDEEKMKLIDKNGIYMHCLPADRDMEVTDPVIDGPQSVVFDEAENRLHAQKAIMALLMGGRL
ncbi:MAG: ornithine carbamoyltransferase [Candidatus Cloacimonetes bacterium]|nr:ornithine carbamoyltransferase [Candidatus Cloacimonadota bacterium]MBS3767429.1 ornithine carbamoyltransferase [Candidatus Cloacimonadota bacterium]